MSPLMAANPYTRRVPTGWRLMVDDLRAIARPRPSSFETRRCTGAAGRMVGRSKGQMRIGTAVGRTHPWRRVFVAVALLCAACGRSGSPVATDPAGPRRIVSLSPPLTDTLEAIGAGPLIAGISDHCSPSGPSARAPRVGSSVTPSYERIARLAPTLIVSEASVTNNANLLRAIAPTELLPWLTLEQVADSIRRLGQVTARTVAAERLADDLERQLSAATLTDAPRVLLVIGSGPKLGEVFFIRNNSLHGAALRAAGGRNAVPLAIDAVPRMSLEALVELDPPTILLLAVPNAATRTELLEPWLRLRSLRAVRSRRIGVILGPDVFNTGPAILDLVAEIRRELGRLDAMGQERG